MTGSMLYFLALNLHQADEHYPDKMTIIRDFYSKNQNIISPHGLLAVFTGIGLFTFGFIYTAIFILLSELIVFISEGYLIKRLINGKI